VKESDKSVNSVRENYDKQQTKIEELKTAMRDAFEDCANKRYGSAMERLEIAFNDDSRAPDWSQSVKAIKVLL
jgi:hypothetical protein